MSNRHAWTISCLALVFAAACSKSDASGSAAPLDAAPDEAAVSSEPEEPTSAEAQPRAAEFVKAKPIYTPDPPLDELALTAAAVAREPVKVKFSYCVDVAGQTTDITLTEASGDADVDRIVRESLETWRFSPHLVDGVATKICSTAEFNFNFA